MTNTRPNTPAKVNRDEKTEEKKPQITTASPSNKKSLAPIKEKANNMEEPTDEENIHESDVESDNSDDEKSSSSPKTNMMRPAKIPHPFTSPTSTLPPDTKVDSTHTVSQRKIETAPSTHKDTTTKKIYKVFKINFQDIEQIRTIRREWIMHHSGEKIHEGIFKHMEELTFIKKGNVIYKATQWLQQKVNSHNKIISKQTGNPVKQTASITPPTDPLQRIEYKCEEEFFIHNNTLVSYKSKWNSAKFSAKKSIELAESDQSSHSNAELAENLRKKGILNCFP